MVSPIAWGKRRFADFFVGRIQKVANRHAEEVRKVQVESGRTERKVIRLDIFEHNVKHRGLIQQEVFTYFVMIDNGKVTLCPPSARWDSHVTTDVPVLIGLRMGHFMLDPGGGAPPVLRNDFTPKRAWFMGRLLTDGDETMLSNLLLLEDKLWDEVLHELRPNDGA